MLKVKEEIGGDGGNCPGYLRKQKAGRERMEVIQGWNPTRCYVYSYSDFCTGLMCFTVLLTSLGIF